MRDLGRREGDWGLVDWPASTEPWTETEGGLYAYAVWAMDPFWQRCNFDSHIFASQGHIVAVRGPMDWEKEFVPWEAREQVREEWEALHPDTNYWQTARSLQDHISSSLAGALYLGSTARPLFNNGYFALDWEHLTGRGKLIVAALETTYGRATYVTMLDA